MTIEKLHQLFLEHPTACTDTRKIENNCVFFALKGANFNGNSFASEALKKGAAFSVVDEEEYVAGEKTILVNDVLKTLQELATFHRKHSKAKIISLTGSNGKTTTKELIHAVLAKKYNTIATKGNLNNHIGVPLTLLSIKSDTEMAVVEMGANHQKEIAFLSTIAQPDYGYITNFGKAHLEGFGGVEGVIKGKSELYDYLIANDRHVFLNADDPIQKQKLQNHFKKIGYSTEDSTYYIIQLLGAQPTVKLKVEEQIITSQLIGKYNFTNCCAAVLMGKYFNVSLDQIKEAIESYIPTNNRSQLIEKSKFRIVLDAYNANPSSMKLALETFAKMEGGPKIVFLGDMFELGESAAMEHQGIADYVHELGLNDGYLIGENFYRTKSDLHQMNSFEALSDHLNDHPLNKGVLLVKGSRGMALERILDLL